MFMPSSLCVTSSSIVMFLRSTLTDISFHSVLTWKKNITNIKILQHSLKIFKIYKYTVVRKHTELYKKQNQSHKNFQQTEERNIPSLKLKYMENMYVWHQSHVIWNRRFSCRTIRTNEKFLLNAHVIIRTRDQKVFLWSIEYWWSLLRHNLRLKYEENEKIFWWCSDLCSLDYFFHLWKHYIQLSLDDTNILVPWQWINAENNFC